MKVSIQIENTLIGLNQPCFIIAEAGVNHNGNINLAKKLIDEAKKAGADAVKFQTWITEEIATESAKQATYQTTNTGLEESQYDMLKRLELSQNDFRELKLYADQKGIIFLSTPDEEKSADFLFELGIPAFKIGSGEVTNLPFLSHIAKMGKPIILSTGMADISEIKEAVKTIRKEKNDELFLLHCTTDYPCSLRDANLRAMPALAKIFKLPVGYSDHSLGIMISVMAVAMGAYIIEKHFTLDKNLPGPDHKASIDPKELKKMVECIRNCEKALGSPDKKPTPSELKNREVVRKVLVAKTDILKGTRITENILALKRAGTGILPKDIKKVIGKKAKRSIRRDNLIKFKDLS